MADFEANFTLDEQPTIEANFTLDEQPTIEANFSIDIITTKHNLLENLDLSNQHPIKAITGLQDTLDTLQDGITENHNEIGRIGQVIGTYGNIVTHDTSEFATFAQGELADNSLQPQDNISELVNNIGYITGITSSDVTTALGYIPYDNSNPNGYTTNIGTVTSVNNVLPVSGNVTLSIPAAQVNSDWNAVSGVAEILNKPTLGTMAAETASDYTKTSGLATVATTGAYSDLTGTPTIPTVNNATLTIQKNSTNVGTFTANASSDTTINITVPTTASDVSALPSSTKYGSSLSLSINSSTYVITAQLKDQDGNNLGSAQTIDLPLESVVVSGSYDDQTKKIILTLQSGSTVEFSVADLVSGLQTEITAQNMLDADLVDDSTSTNKFVTSSEKSAITTALQPNDNISNLINDAGYTTNIGTVTSVNNVSPVNGNVTLSIPTVPTNISAFTNDEGYITSSALTGYATQAWVGQQGYITGITSSDVTTALGYTPYNSSNPNGYITSSALSGYQTTANLVTSVSSSSTDSQYPSAKLFYDTCGDIESAINTIRGV